MKKRKLRKFLDSVEKRVGRILDKGLGEEAIEATGEKIFAKENNACGIRVKEIMQKPVLIGPDTTKKELFAIAKKHPNTKVFFVTDQKKTLLGAVYEDDLFLMLIPNELFGSIGLNLAMDLEKKFFAKKAKELMRKCSIAYYENDDILKIALQFARIEPNEMAVLNKRKEVVGFISQGILLRHLPQK